MVKADELRIGNVVKCDNCPYHELYVWRIDNHGATLRYSNESEYGWTNKMQGIPLTEEWLLRMGFNRRTPFFKEMTLPYWANNGLLLFFNDTQPEYKWKVGFAEMRNGEYFVATSRWVDKVHEIQNVYYEFLGTELTIK